MTHIKHRPPPGSFLNRFWRIYTRTGGRSDKVGKDRLETAFYAPRAGSKDVGLIEGWHTYEEVLCTGDKKQ